MPANKIPLFSRLKTQILASVLVCCLSISAVLTVVLFSISNRLIVDTTIGNALKIAQISAENIDVEAFKTIQTLQDEETQAYKDMRAKLSDIRVLSGCRFVYTMRRDASGDYVYVVDGSSEDEISNVGDVGEYLEAFDVVMQGEPYKEKEILGQGEWGILASAYYPLVDDAGRVAGFVGVDYDAASVYAGLQRFKLAAVCIALAGALVCAVVGIALANGVSKPVLQTADFANALAGGDFDRPMNIKTKNEVGALARVLDTEMRQAFISVEAARELSEKQARYQNEQVNKVLVSLGRLAKGELAGDMHITPPDADTQEVYAIYAQIAQNLKSAVDTIRAYVGELSAILDLMAQGDFSYGIETRYLGDFVRLKDSVNGIADSVSRALSDVATATASVAASTYQVAQNSQEIARGTARQASAIDELTASVTHIANQSQQNALDAQKANALTGSAKQNAVSGNEKMRQMQTAMEQINESSQSIGRIISVIDEISFQTNILALNAAVEAARAGTYGKGFAVVAQEVRGLAQKSADAAREIADLIEESVSRVERGTKIADDTAKVLEGIVKGVEQAESLIGNIATSSTQQVTAIAQVNKGIDQVAGVVHVNIAASQQTAATSQELSGQAELLKGLVEKFKLKE